MCNGHQTVNCFLYWRLAAYLHHDDNGVSLYTCPSCCPSTQPSRQSIWLSLLITFHCFVAISLEYWLSLLCNWLAVFASRIFVCKLPKHSCIILVEIFKCWIILILLDIIRTDWNTFYYVAIWINCITKLTQSPSSCLSWWCICVPVCLFVLYGFLIWKLQVAEKPRLVWIFPSAGVSGVPIFCA